MRTQIHEQKQGIFTAKIFSDMTDGEYIVTYHKRARYLGDPAAFHSHEFLTVNDHASVTLNRLNEEELSA